MNIEMLTDRSGYLQDIIEVRNQWIEDILNYLGIETDIFHDKFIEKLYLVEYLVSKKIDIVGYPTIDGLQIYHEGNLVGEWGGPDYIIERDEDGKTFYRISIETWSILEEDMEL